MIISCITLTVLIFLFFLYIYKQSFIKFTHLLRSLRYTHLRHICTIYKISSIHALLIEACKCSAEAPLLVRQFASWSEESTQAILVISFLWNMSWSTARPILKRRSSTYLLELMESSRLLLSVYQFTNISQQPEISIRTSFIYIAALAQSSNARVSAASVHFTTRRIFSHC